MARYVVVAFDDDKTSEEFIAAVERPGGFFFLGSDGHFRIVNIPDDSASTKAFVRAAFDVLTPDPELEQAFMEFVDVDANTGCWLWKGYKNEYGYGKFRNRLAHLAAYNMFIGEVPDGLELGHACENKCANWMHVRPITHSQNMRELLQPHHNSVKTHCPRGHEYSNENTYVNPKGGRVCRTCMRAKCKEWYNGDVHAATI